MTTTSHDDLTRYLSASQALAQTATEVEELARSEAVETYRRQIDLLGRRLQTNPRAFRDMFISDGMGAIAAEFRQPELSEEFTTALWQKLLLGNDASLVLMRFVWNLPLGAKRKFIRALDSYLSERYPVFKGLSVNWPAGSSIPPYIRTPEQRSEDFELVNQGYLGYMNIGYTQREVDLLVWLEALRDKQCADKPCQLGELLAGRKEPRGGCPVQVHIPDMMQLLGTGHFREALDLIESINPLPNVTGRVCPQELQCQSVCAHSGRPIEIGQLEWFLPQRDRVVDPDGNIARYANVPDPWQVATKPPVAVVGSGPSGLINAFLLAAEGHPVTIFESFHRLGGVLRYGIPEFRLPNSLIDDVVEKITALGGRFVTNFVVGKTATLAELKEAGFSHIFVGSGAGLPRFMNVPGEHLLNVMSANEFLTRVNLMQGHRPDHETPLPECRGKKIMIIGGGNTAMDAARTARRLGGKVTIVYRRTRQEMPARVEELAHALEEGIELATLRSPSEFRGDDRTGFVNSAVLEVMELGAPDASGRRRPMATGTSETVDVDLVIMALGNSANPIIRDSEPELTVTTAGALELTEGSQATSIGGVYSGGDAARGGSTAVKAAGDGQAAAREIREASLLPAAQIIEMVAGAKRFTDLASAPNTIIERRELQPNIIELTVNAPVIAKNAQAGQFVRVLAEPQGELVPLTLADWDAEAGTIVLVVQGMGTTSKMINAMKVGDRLEGIAGPLGQPSELHKIADDQTVVFTAGGVGLPPVYPIARANLQLGNHVTLIAGFRSADLLFWVGEGERVDELQAEFGDQLEVIYTSNDGSFGIEGFVTVPLKDLLDANQRGEGRPIAEVTTIGPPMMMRSVSDLTKPYGAKTVASLNSIMVDATGMCGACMVPVLIDGKLIRKHACIDGPELDSHAIDWDKFLPRFNLFKSQEQQSKVKHGLA
ncbi:MAG: sulfide/dihydroorotate dehydrogenase-like FAD/NAD-binding protein [Propionibacterium sp.]|nr:sulfide/dihydroorotate dehydrogenase-like FAD/NAD-binding protein [Propionibacterium sp.]NLI84696.1 sulfide/dihydroorotate dehydrogenase-like FAD/NAD-binding protein [Propionibacterium sp.]